MTQATVLDLPFCSKVKKWWAKERQSLNPAKCSPNLSESMSLHLRVGTPYEKARKCYHKQNSLICRVTQYVVEIIVGEQIEGEVSSRGNVCIASICHLKIRNCFQQHARENRFSCGSSTAAIVQRINLFVNRKISVSLPRSPLLSIIKRSI